MLSVLRIVFTKIISPPFFFVFFAAEGDAGVLAPAASHASVPQQTKKSTLNPNAPLFIVGGWFLRQASSAVTYFRGGTGSDDSDDGDEDSNSGDSDDSDDGDKNAGETGGTPAQSEPLSADLGSLKQNPTHEHLASSSAGSTSSTSSAGSSTSTKKIRVRLQITPAHSLFFVRAH